MRARAKVAIAAVRSVVDVAVVNHDDVLQPVACHAGPLDMRLGEIKSRCPIQVPALHETRVLPAPKWIVDKTMPPIRRLWILDFPGLRVIISRRSDRVNEAL